MKLSRESIVWQYAKILKSNLVLIVVLVLESKGLYSLLLNHVNRMSLVQLWVVLELMVTWITDSKLWHWLMKTCALTAASATWPVMTVVIKPLHLMPRPTCLMWLRTVLDVLCAFQFVLLLVSSVKCSVWISQSILLMKSFLCCALKVGPYHFSVFFVVFL